MKNKLTLLQIIMLVALIALLATLLLPKVATAQPYFTNTGTIYGAQTYNQAYPTPLQPSKTLAAQYAAGTLAGSLPPGTVPYQGFYTNVFATNIFSAAPFIVLSTSGTNSIGAVISTSPTNFVCSQLGTNQTIYWEATGH